MAGFLSTTEYGVWGVLSALLGTLLILKQVGIGEQFVQQDEDDQELEFQRAFTLELVIQRRLRAGRDRAARRSCRPSTNSPSSSRPGCALLLVVALRRAAGAAVRSSTAAWTSAPAAPAGGRAAGRLRADHRARRSPASVTGPSSSAALPAQPHGGRGASELRPTACACASTATRAQRTALLMAHPARRALGASSWRRASPRSATPRSGLAGFGIVVLTAQISQFADRADQAITDTLYPAICAVKDRVDLLHESFVKSNRLVLMWSLPFGAGRRPVLRTTCSSGCWVRSGRRAWTCYAPPPCARDPPDRLQLGRLLPGARRHPAIAVAAGVGIATTAVDRAAAARLEGPRRPRGRLRAGRGRSTGCVAGTSCAGCSPHRLPAPSSSRARADGSRRGERPRDCAAWSRAGARPGLDRRARAFCGRHGCAGVALRAPAAARGHVVPASRWLTAPSTGWRWRGWRVPLPPPPDGWPRWAVTRRSARRPTTAPACPSGRTARGPGCRGGRAAGGPRGGHDRAAVGGARARGRAGAPGRSGPRSPSSRTGSAAPSCTAPPSCSEAGPGACSATAAPASPPPPSC